jgi:hypothetical protein
MTQRSDPPRRKRPTVTPDSLPKPDENEGMPDEVRRRDPPRTTPDSLPRRDEDAPPRAGAPAPDGGSSTHPIHDEDQEDLTPGDYEAQIDEIEEEAAEDEPGEDEEAEEAERPVPSE